MFSKITAIKPPKFGFALAIESTLHRGLNIFEPKSGSPNFGIFTEPKSAPFYGSK